MRGIASGAVMRRSRSRSDDRLQLHVDDDVGHRWRAPARVPGRCIIVAACTTSARVQLAANGVRRDRSCRRSAAPVPGQPHSRRRTASPVRRSRCRIVERSEASPSSRRRQCRRRAASPVGPPWSRRRLPRLPLAPVLARSSLRSSLALVLGRSRRSLQHQRGMVVHPPADAADQRHCGTGHLTVTAGAAQLNHRLGQRCHALEVEARQLAAAGVDGSAPPGPACRR